MPIFGRVPVDTRRSNNVIITSKRRRFGEPVAYFMWCIAVSEVCGWIQECFVTNFIVLHNVLWSTASSSSGSGSYFRHLSFKQGNQPHVQRMRGNMPVHDFGSQIALLFPLQPELGDVSEILGAEVGFEAAILQNSSVPLFSETSTGFRACKCNVKLNRHANVIRST